MFQPHPCPSPESSGEGRSKPFIALCGRRERDKGERKNRFGPEGLTKQRFWLMI
jgi:hypothetical protein